MRTFSRKISRTLRPLIAGVVTTACVTGRESRPTQPESAQAPAPRPELAHPDTPDKEWVAGYWRWDGVRYVWIPGRLEPKKPAYVR
jgi:hypothetical protein